MEKSQNKICCSHFSFDCTAGGAVLIVCCPPVHIAIWIVANVKVIVQTEIQVTCLFQENC